MDSLAIGLGWLLHHPLAILSIAVGTIGFFTMVRTTVAAHVWLRQHAPRADEGSHRERLPLPMFLGLSFLLGWGAPTHTRDDALRRYALVCKMHGEPTPLVTRHRMGLALLAAGFVGFFGTLFWG